MNSKSITPVSTTHREDYCPPAFWIDSVDLTFDLDAAKTRVLNKMRVRRNPAVAAQALRLDGDGLTLARVLVNGQGTSFKIDGSALVLENLPEGEQRKNHGQRMQADAFTHQPRRLYSSSSHASSGVSTG